MSQALVRDLSHGTLNRLKASARRQGRSLQAELRRILEEAARASVADTQVAAARLRRALTGRRHTDSGALQAEGRRR